MATEIEEVREKIKKAEKQIENVDKRIEDVEVALAKLASEADANHFLKKEELLWKEKEPLLKEQQHLLKEMKLLLKGKDILMKEEQMLKEKEQMLKEKGLMLREDLLLKEKELLLKEGLSLKEKELLLKEEQLLLKAGTPGPSSVVPEKLLQELSDFLVAVKVKDKLKKSVCISSVSQSIWGTVQRQGGLKLVYEDLGSKCKRLSDLPAFGWEEKLERSQADRYMVHLNKIVSARKWMLIDAANNHPTLLSGSFAGWNFKGTTDVAFVHRDVGKFDPRLGLRCLFELKKDCRPKEDGGQGDLRKASTQTLICLVMANVFAQQFRPYAVLTDLKTGWTIYWMDGSTIYWYIFQSRAEAVGFIEELLQDSDDNELGIQESHARPSADDDSLLFIKRRKMYEPPEMDNLKDLLGFIPDEEILDARAQIAVQQLLKVLHIPILPIFSRGPDVDVPDVDVDVPDVVEHWPSHMFF